ncbi:unnamed protein product [Spodoptera exigua]|nr:unnamed protein product [Spodoptera exigua]
MNPLALLVAFMLMGNVRAIVELNCSDNATCIDHMAKEILRSLKEQKSVRVFNVLTIEPLRTRQARSKDWWLTNFLDSHAFSFDWNDYTFRLSQVDGRNDALDLEIYDGRTAKEGFFLMSSVRVRGNVAQPTTFLNIDHRTTLGLRSLDPRHQECRILRRLACEEEDNSLTHSASFFASLTASQKEETASLRLRPGASDRHRRLARANRDVSDPNAKKSSSKNEEEKPDDKKAVHKLGLRRRQKKKVMQVIIPLLFGMKSAGMAMFAMAIVTVLTLKAFLASKVALLVTVGMAVKKLYETYGSGVGLQNHPYLYSQYPIDFPSASSHAYSVSGVSPQFASPEMYSPTAMGAHGQTNEIIHQSDASAQQSQQAPTLLVNSTRAEQRWDGKSKLLKFLEPIIDGIKYVIDPIANVFFGAMPATFRGLTSDASKAKSVEPVDDDLDELEIVKKPRQILVPQPRNIAQRKMTYRKNRNRPKKYADLKSLKSEEPGFYTAAYRVVMITLDLFDGIFGVNEALESHLLGDERIEKRRRKKNRRKSINRSQAQTKASGDVQCFMDSRALLQNPFRPTATAIESSPDYDNAHVRNATDVWSPHHNAAVSVNKIGHTHGSSGDI